MLGVGQLARSVPANKAYLSTIDYVKNEQSDKLTKEPSISALVPSTTAYATAFGILFISGIAGGLIGFALMKVFFPDLSVVGRSIGTCFICVLIIYGVSVITSLGLEASVEWKSRKSIGGKKSRPSRMVRSNAKH